MAISTRTIGDTIEWAKRLSFNRNPVIGNSLNPALNSANLVAKTILSPPFEWWWNNEELVFTCNATPNTATSTVISIVSGVLTVTATNTFAIGDLLFPSAVVSPVAALNGLILEVLTSSSTQFTAAVNLPNLSGTVGVFTNLTTQDYTISTPEFSHIEHASVLDLTAAGVPAKWQELTIKNELALENTRSRPMFIAPHVESAAGLMTFRVFPAPDKNYPVAIHVQKVAPLYTGINQVWGIPDFMQNIYEWGFMALIWHFADDPRAAYANNQFKAALLSRAEGLTEEQKNIFLNNWEGLQAGYAMKLQQGIAARGQ